MCIFYYAVNIAVWNVCKIVEFHSHEDQNFMRVPGGTGYGDRRDLILTLATAMMTYACEKAELEHGAGKVKWMPQKKGVKRAAPSPDHTSIKQPKSRPCASCLKINKRSYPGKKTKELHQITTNTTMYCTGCNKYLCPTCHTVNWNHDLLDIKSKNTLPSELIRKRAKLDSDEAYKPPKHYTPAMYAGY